MNNDFTKTFHLANFLPYRLDYLAKRMSSAFSLIYKTEFDISVPEWRVTALLGEHGKLTSSMICTLSLMDKVKVSRAISGLRKKGWVDEIVDCKDNRAKLISLSEQGLLCYSEISPRARKWDAELLDVLKVGEYKELLCILDKLNSQLSTFLDESSAGR